MPENFPQVNPTEAGSRGYPNGIPRGAARNDVRAAADRGAEAVGAEVSGRETAAWAEMLARIGRQNCRLNSLIERARPRNQRARSAGRAILEELEKERTRIARDLHAGAGQPLAGIKMNLDLIDGCAAELPEGARTAVTRLRTLTDQALAQVRAVSHRLHPPAWQQLSTEQAIRSLVESSGMMAQMEMVLDFQPLPTEPDHGVKVSLYRCAQECLSNISRHAEATRIEIRLRPVDGAVELMIRDNGKGLTPGAPKGSGIGLLALHEHSEAMGGTTDIASGPGGTTVTVRIPLREESDEDDE